MERDPAQNQRPLHGPSELSLSGIQDGDLAIRTLGLAKEFGEHMAVRDLTLSVERGIIFGLIGPSGCGKTTMVRLLTGVYRPTRGEALVLGEHPLAFKRETRRRIGYMLQQSALYPDLTVLENLRFTRSIYGVSPFRRSYMDDVLEFVELSEHGRKRVRDLSGGMQRRLSLATALLHNPELIFLDEPTGGVDPVLRRKFWDHFQVLREQGRTLFVTTQYVGEAAYCDWVAVMQAGRLLALDTPAGLRRQASGGEVVHVVVQGELPPAAVEELQCWTLVKSTHRSGERELRLVVDDASLAIPMLVQYFRDRDTVTESIDEYVPPFDDVFVQLVEQGEER